MRQGATVGRVIVERYELLEVVGDGPVGVVWRARDRQLDREVAVREVELPDVLDDGEQEVLAARVLREARAAAGFRHPGAVSVLDVVDAGGRPFVVMELVDAPTLEEVVAANGPMPIEWVAAVGRDILNALATAHARGLVHRDVHPSNILLTPECARLADFGVASMVDDPRVSTSGALRSRAYLAPEQTGSAGARAASDLWSLGATLYFAVEGVAPFDDVDPRATLEAIANRPPRQPERAGAIGPVLGRLLQNDPDSRGDERTLWVMLAGLAGTASSGTAAGTVPGVPLPGAETPADDDAGPAPIAPNGDGEVLSEDLSGARSEDLSDGRSEDRGDGLTASLPPLDLRPAPDSESPPPPPPSSVAPPMTREPWFFDLPVEAAEQPPPRPPVYTSAPPPPKRPGRLPKGLWLALLALGVGVVMVALLTTGGRHGRTPPSVPAAAEVPGDLSKWVPYTDPGTDFSIRYPPSWNLRRLGSSTAFVDVSSGAYLKVDHQKPPPASPVERLTEVEAAFAALHPSYERIELGPTTYQGFPAAFWEFTYTDNGLEVHALDLAFATPTDGFGLVFQTQARDWAHLQDVFDDFKASFRAP